MATPFTDTINTYGWVQYFDRQGVEWRRESKGNRCYAFYRKEGDCFVRIWGLRAFGRSIEEIHEEFIEGLDSMCD